VANGTENPANEQTAGVCDTIFQHHVPVVAIGRGGGFKGFLEGGGSCWLQHTKSAEQQDEIAANLAHLSPGIWERIMIPRF